MTPLVIIPARVGSKGVPNKNFRTLPDGSTLVSRAVAIAESVGQWVITTDNGYDLPCGLHGDVWIRQPHLCTDDAAMRDVVEDVLNRFDGSAGQVIVLLQPTTPFRSLDVIQQCVTLAMDGADVATVSLVPEKYQRTVDTADWVGTKFFELPLRRQDCESRSILTGDCYAFKRGHGWPAVWTGLTVPESVNIDTEADWDEACAIIRRGRA